MAESRVGQHFAHDPLLQAYKKYWQTTIQEWVEKFKADVENREFIFLCICNRLISYVISPDEKKYWRELIAEYIKKDDQQSGSNVELLLIGLDWYTRISPSVFFEETYEFVQQNEYQQAEHFFTRVKEFYEKNGELKEAEKRNFSISLCFLAELEVLAKRTKCAQKLLTKPCQELESPFAMAKLAKLNKGGDECFREAASKGDRFSQEYVASVSFDNKKFDDSREYAAKALEGGSGKALLLLALMNLEGESVDKYKHKAALYMRFTGMDPRFKDMEVFEKKRANVIKKIFYPARSEPSLDFFLEYQLAFLNKSTSQVSRLFLKNPDDFFETMMRSDDKWNEIKHFFSKEVLKKWEKLAEMIGWLRIQFPQSLVKLMLDYYAPVPQDFVLSVNGKVDKQRVEKERERAEKLQQEKFQQEKAEERQRLKRYQADQQDYKQRFLWATDLPPEKLRSSSEQKFSENTAKPLRFP